MEIFLGFVLLSFNGYHSVIGTGDFYHDTFPNDFLWGVATSSYQIEGAWNEGGKSEHIWDRFSHDNNNWHNDTGDIACDSYHKYMEDIQLIRSLGVDFYRFSIAWTRIIPDPIAYRTGRNKSLNQPGVNYYNNVINELIKYNIKPLVTLYHWDLPQSLQEQIGGWNGSDIVDYYNDYADAAFKTFGDRVKHWITFNEPWVICWMGHGSAEYAPGIKEPSVTPYRCGHHIIKSHAKAYDTYKHRYKTTQKGIVGITMNSDTMHPKNESNQEHIDAAERGQQFMLGWFAHPIYKDGDYPKVMKDNIGDRLPKFTPQEIALNKGSFDFFGLNHYTTVLVEPAKKEFGFPGDLRLQLSRDPSWTGSGSYWLKVVPWGFRDMLNWIKKEYNNPKVIITENGITDNNGTTNDPHRIYYYRQYINQLLKAIKQDGCNVFGYTAWCLLDTFEWNRGFHEKFGLHSTDFSDPARPRTPKRSAAAYTEIVNQNGFPPVGTSTTASSGNTKIINQNGFPPVGISTPASSSSSDVQNLIMLILLCVSFFCILNE